MVTRHVLCPECGPYPIRLIRLKSSRHSALLSMRRNSVRYCLWRKAQYEYRLWALNAISQAEVLIVAGSSLVVQPAAGLLDYYEGNKMVIIKPPAVRRSRQSEIRDKNRCRRQNSSCRKRHPQKCRPGVLIQAMARNPCEREAHRGARNSCVSWRLLQQAFEVLPSSEDSSLSAKHQEERIMLPVNLYVKARSMTLALAP